jgi:phage terminase large subunit-like protein
VDRDAIELALGRYRKLLLRECFDASNLQSKPTAAQLECLKDINTISHRYVTAGNQAGKSQLGARECAWIFTETHPFWKRQPGWGNESLVMIVVGRTSKQIEEVLWRKISGFIHEDDVQIQRVGGVIQKVVHKKNKNTIIFASHHNENEAREKLQAFVAHYVWLDELPGNVRLIEELHRRVQAKRGVFISTFTPKTPNQEIQALIDNSKAPLAKKYQFAMLDNPIYNEDDKLKIIESLATYPEAYRNTILYGDWYTGDNAVYHFDRPSMVASPNNYSRSWRHVEASDPAAASKFGFTLWAEDPSTTIWYCVKSQYIHGIAVPGQLVNEVRRLTDGYNIVKRICDYSPWYVAEAAQHGLHYESPLNKNAGRKDELIKNLQTALSEGTIKIPSWNDDLINELETCQWSESGNGKIMNSSTFHLIDSTQYFVDGKPKSEAKYIPRPWHQELREANQARKKAENLAAKIQANGRAKWIYQGQRLRRFS